MPPSRGSDRDPAGIDAPETRVSGHATAHALGSGERWLRRAGLRLVGYLILAILVIKLIPGLRETLEDLERLSLPWLAAVLALEVLSETGFVISWHAIVDPDSRLGPRERTDRRSACVGPTGRGGVRARRLAVKRRRWHLAAASTRDAVQARRRAQLNLSFLNTAIDAVALVIVGVGLATGILSGEGDLALTLPPAALAALGIAAALLAAARAKRRAPARRSHRRIDSAVSTLADAVQDTGRLLVHRAGLRSVVGALGYLCFDVLVLYTALVAIHAHPQPTFGAVVMAYIIGALGGSLPLPASIGTVAGIVGMLIVYGVGHDAAVAAVVLYQAVGLLVPIVGGGIAYLLLRREFRNARDRPEETPVRTSVIRL